MIDNVPQVVETLIANISALSTNRLLRPSGLYRKHADTDAMMPGREVAACLKMMPLNASIRKTMHFEVDDLETLSMVSGFLYAKHERNIQSVINSWGKKELLLEIDPLTAEELAQAVEAVKKNISPSSVVVPDIVKQTFAHWSVGYKLYEYTAATTVDFDKFFEEDAK